MIYRLVLLLGFLLSVWVPRLQEWTRLPADLFFLGDGQIWRLAAAGSLQAVSPVDVTVTGFAAAPGGEAVAYQTAAGEVFYKDLDGAPVRIDEEAGSPEGQHVLAWSPAGRPIAYTAGDMVRVYLPGKETPLEAGDGPFAVLRWSPGGRYLACGKVGGSWMIYRLGWDRLELAGTLEGENTIAWASDRALLVAPATGGLRVVSLVDGGGYALVDGGVRVNAPVVDEDIVYYFMHELGTGAPGVLTMQPITQEAGPETIGARAFDLGGARWSARGLILTVLGPDGLSVVDPVSGEMTLIPGTAGVQTWAWAWAPEPDLVDMVTGLPGNLYFLAPNPDTTQLWRLDWTTGRPVFLTTSASDIQSFDVVSGTPHLAYLAAGRLMVADEPGAGDAVEIAAVDVEDAGLAFSPDGKMLAFADDGIFVVSADGGAPPVSVRANPADRRYFRPRWSPDGTWLLINIETPEGTVETALLSIIGRGPLRFEVLCSGARWIAGNKVLCWGAAGPQKATPGLYLITPGDPPRVETLLDGAWSIVEAVYMPSDGTIVFLEGVNAPDIMAVQPVRLAPSGVPEPFGVGGVMDKPRLSPDGSMIAGLDGAGRVVLDSVQTGYRARLALPDHVHSLKWGE